MIPAPEKKARRRTFFLLLLVLSAPIFAAPAAKDFSGQPPGATVEDLLAWAEQHNADLVALQHESEAATARVQAAGALPDPVLRIELQDITRDNTESPSLLPSRVGSTKYTVLQTLPLWGKRALRRDIARAQIDQTNSRGLSLSSELRSRIKINFAQHYQAYRATRLTREMLQLFRDLERVVQTRYANGLAPQQDVIKTQLEQTALRAELITLETEQHHARARINSLLNRPATAQLAEPRALRPVPRDAELDSEKLLDRAQRTNPALLAQAAQITAADSTQQLVKKNRYPDLTLGISPIQRSNRIASWDFMVEFNIPLQQATRRSQETEASAMLAAATVRKDAIASQIGGELDEALTGLESARTQEELLEHSLIPQAELTLQSALAGYQNGKVDFATLLEAQRQIRQARISQLKAQMEQQTRLADVERILGEDI